LVHYLANRVGHLPVVIVGTYRDSPSDMNPALVRTVEELLRLGLRPLKLEGLSEEAVGQIDEEARAVLTAAAVIGHSFPFALLQALQDQTMPDDLLTAIEQASAWIPPVAKRGRNCSKATDN